MKLNFPFLMISLLTATLIASCDSSGSGGITPTGIPVIRYNQTGYFPTAPKEFAMINSTETAFDILNDSDDTVAFSGTLTNNVYYTGSDENVRLGDFTTVQTAGTYKIKVGDLVSGTFIIADDALDSVSDSLLKFYYFQRAGMELVSTYAGIYARAAGHTSTDNPATYHSTSGKSGTKATPGGWYDAGDYGKYIVNGGIAVGTLLGLYEIAGDVTGDSSLNIPESGNSKSDLLDEIKYELDWFKTMQDTDGGVFFKVAGVSWPGSIMPSDDTMTRYIIGKSTTST